MPALKRLLCTALLCIGAGARPGVHASPLTTPTSVRRQALNISIGLDDADISAEDLGSNIIDFGGITNSTISGYLSTPGRQLASSGLGNPLLQAPISGIFTTVLNSTDTISISISKCVSLWQQPIGGPWRLPDQPSQLSPNTTWASVWDGALASQSQYGSFDNALKQTLLVNLYLLQTQLQTALPQLLCNADGITTALENTRLHNDLRRLLSLKNFRWSFLFTSSCDAPEEGLCLSFQPLTTGPQNQDLLSSPLAHGSTGKTIIQAYLPIILLPIVSALLTWANSIALQYSQNRLERLLHRRAMLVVAGTTARFAGLIPATSYGLAAAAAQDIPGPPPCLSQSELDQLFSLVGNTDEPGSAIESYNTGLVEARREAGLTDEQCTA